MTQASTTAAPRDLPGEKAGRIIDAMRASVALRGAAGSTFDHVAREAGVSRGLLHYYFGTKERLLVEVVRRDSEIRMGLLDASLAPAQTVDDVVDAFVRSLEDVLEHDPGFYALVFELFTASRRNADSAKETAELSRRVREHVAGLLAAKERDGVLALAADPDSVASLLLSLGDGIALKVLSEPGSDHAGMWAAGVTCARSLLREPA